MWAMHVSHWAIPNVAVFLLKGGSLSIERSPTLLFLIQRCAIELSPAWLFFYSKVCHWALSCPQCCCFWYKGVPLSYFQRGCYSKVGHWALSCPQRCCFWFKGVPLNYSQRGCFYSKVGHWALSCPERCYFFDSKVGHSAIPSVAVFPSSVSAQSWVNYHWQYFWKQSSFVKSW